MHRAVPQAARPEPDPTGIDYLGMVAAAHEEAAGTGAKIDFTRWARLTGRNAAGPGHGAAAVSAAPWAAHFGLTATPFGKNIAAKDLFARRRTPRRSPGSASASWNPRLES